MAALFLQRIHKYGNCKTFLEKVLDKSSDCFYLCTTSFEPGELQLRDAPWSEKHAVKRKAEIQGG